MRMKIWLGRNGRHMRGPIRVLRGKRWRCMRKRLEQFADAVSKWNGGEAWLSARPIWREGNRKETFDEPEDSLWAEGWTWRVWCAS